MRTSKSVLASAHALLQLWYTLWNEVIMSFGPDEYRLVAMDSDNVMVVIECPNLRLQMYHNTVKVSISFCINWL